MPDAFICDAIRTPFGRYGGALSTIRTDDLAAIPIASLMTRNPGVDWSALGDVVMGCANQAGEDNRNVARMASLLAGMPASVSAVTVNRLCGSGLDAVAIAARAIRCGDADLMIAGGVESMTRAPFVQGKVEAAFARSSALQDTTIGWRFINARMKDAYGVDSMPETAEIIAREHRISRLDQDALALASQRKALAAQAAGLFAAEIVAVTVAQKGAAPRLVEADEAPRATSADALARLKGVVSADGTVSAGNSSGINDGACALLLAGPTAIDKYGLRPIARIVHAATVGVEPRVMGIGPAPATSRLLQISGLTLPQIDILELNEAFAAQALAVLRQLGIADDDPRVNPNGGAIALGHPLGASGARLAATAALQLQRIGGRYAICTMCIGVGQGIALLIERV